MSNDPANGKLFINVLPGDPCTYGFKFGVDLEVLISIAFRLVRCNRAVEEDREM